MIQAGSSGGNSHLKSLGSAGMNPYGGLTTTMTSTRQLQQARITAMKRSSFCQSLWNDGLCAPLFVPYRNLRKAELVPQLVGG